MLLKPKSKLIMIGDSITDCGRARPIGEGLFGALGNGYVSMVDSLLKAVYPDLNLRIVNMGTSGNTSSDLANRWQPDVLDLMPQYVCIMIGTNDVWRQFDSPTRPNEAVLLQQYSVSIHEIVRATQPKVDGIILMTPFYIEPLTADPMRAMMDQYSNQIRHEAKTSNTILVDTQAAFDNALKHCHSSAISWDRVHPNEHGNAIIAKAFLDAIGFVWGDATYHRIPPVQS